MPVHPFRLLTLGRLTLLDASGNEDRSLSTRRRKLALLATLAIARRPLSRDLLVDMFWGDQPEERAKHSLSDALSHLRRALGPDSLSTRRAEVELSPNCQLEVDAIELAVAAEQGAFSKVVDLYSGPFLDAVHVGGSPRWEQWVGQQRSRYDALFQDGCKRECARLAADRDWSRSAEVAERWLQSAPMSPHAALRLFAAITANGTPEDDIRALAAYERLVRQLRVEYDCAPDNRVVLAAREIQDRVRDAQHVEVEEVEMVHEVVPSPPSNNPTPPQQQPVAPATRVWRWTFSAAAMVMAVAAMWGWRTVRADERGRPIRAMNTNPIRGAPAAPENQFVTTNSSEALERYHRASRELRIGGDRAKAISLLEEAIALDSTFVSATRRLASLHASDESSTGRMVELLTQAMRHATHVSDRERFLVEGDFHVNVTHDYARASAAYRSLLTIDSSNGSAWHKLGMVYQYVGDSRRAAEAYGKALKLGTGGAATWGNRIDALYASGERRVARQALNEMAVALPGHPAVFMQTAFLDAAEGDFVHAEHQVRAYIASTRTDAREQALGHRFLARVWWTAGHHVAGDNAQKLAVEFEKRTGDNAAALREMLVMAIAPRWQHRVQRVDYSAVVRALDEQPFDSLDAADRPYAELATALALSGHSRRARTIIDRQEREVRRGGREQDSSAMQVARGTVAIVEGRFRDAVRELQHASTTVCVVCGLPELGLAYEALGVRDSAVIAYRRYMETPTLWRTDLLDAYHRQWVTARIANVDGKEHTRE